MAKILICTGIFPPQIGGPAQYAKEVSNELKGRGHEVGVLTYKLEHRLPTLIRHELFFWRVLFSLAFSFRDADFVLVLDTFSVGWPAVAAAKILRKKIIIRTGGDFLWESYVERTGDQVLFRDFYSDHVDDKSPRASSRAKLNWKERIIFEITKWTLQNASAVIFSTDWQRKIFESAYELNPTKNFIVENFYGGKAVPADVGTEVKTEEKIFITGGRPVKLKNFERLTVAFEQAKKMNPTISLRIENLPHEKFIERLKVSYAVILISISDISPNMILEAIRYNKPFILTRETGLYEKLKDISIFVDPKDVEDIRTKILFLADKDNCYTQKKKVESFNFEHSWSEICREILTIFENLTTVKE